MPPGPAASGVTCGVERIADPSVGAPGSESGGCRERHGSPAGVRGGVRPRSHRWVWLSGRAGSARHATRHGQLTVASKRLAAWSSPNRVSCQGVRWLSRVSPCT
jgi:hypothetical protein